jgi:hypothetical protein
VGVVLDFIARGIEPNALTFKEPKLTAVLALVGVVLSAYIYWMMTNYGWHIPTAWNSTDFLRGKLDGMKEVCQERYVTPKKER